MTATVSLANWNTLFNVRTNTYQKKSVFASPTPTPFQKRCGGPALLCCQTLTQPISHSPSSKGWWGQNAMKKLKGQDKDKKITYKIPSRSKHLVMVRKKKTKTKIPEGCTWGMQSVCKRYSVISFSSRFSPAPA